MPNPAVFDSKESLFFLACLHIPWEGTAALRLLEPCMLWTMAVSVERFLLSGGAGACEGFFHARPAQFSFLAINA